MITAEQYVDIIEDLYNIPLDVKQDMLAHKDEIENRLIGYTETELRKVVEDYFLTVDKRFFPKLGGVLLMLKNSRSKFVNPYPIDIDSLEPFEDSAQFFLWMKPIYDEWFEHNSYLKTKIAAIKDEMYKPVYWGQTENVLKMAQGLAEEIWEYRDTLEIKNSLLDPNLWALCRFKIEPATQSSGLMIIGYYLRKMWLENKKVNSDK